MRQAETRPGGTYNAIWRILLGVLVMLAVVVVVVAIQLPQVRDLLRNPGGLFAGDDTLVQAAEDLASANNKLRLSPNDESAHIARARAYLAFGYLEGARLEYESWHDRGSAEWGAIGRSLDELQLKTDEIRALLEYAETSPYPSEQYPPIYTLLDDIAERFEGIPHYRALFLKGYLLLREGRRAEAEPIFGEELQHYVPLMDYVKYNHARSLMVSGSEDDALAAFDDFLDDYPSSRLAPLAHLEKINILRDLGRDSEALEECRRAIDRYPSSPFADKTLRKWAEIYESRMDFELGGAMRARLLREFPDSDEASDTVEMFFGGVYALQLLTGHDRLAVAYAAIGSHTSDAFEVLSELSESNVLSPEEKAQACHGAGRCEYSLGRYYECINWEERARALAEGSEWADRAGIRIGHSYWSLNKEDLAIDSWWEVVRGRGPVASVAAQILWQRAYELGDLETVGDACRYVVEEYPESDEAPAAMTMLAYLGCRNRQYQSALGYAERCVQAFPESLSFAEASFWRARSLEGLGRSVESGQAYENLSVNAPWSYWGIRARERTGIDGETAALDPFDFDTDRVGFYDGALAKAWELYDAGALDLAESEFILARDNGQNGALCGLALTRAEQGDIRDGILALRDAAAIGDQAHVTPERQERILDRLYPRVYMEEIRTAAMLHDIPPSWLWGAMRQESSYDPRALSRSGARGLIQIMPETGRFIADRRGADTFDPEVLWNPEINIDYGAWYFDYLRGEVGGDRLMDILAAYNGGPGNLRRWRSELPTRDDDIFVSAIPNEETRNFTRWVYANVRMYEAILESEGFQLVPY